ASCKSVAKPIRRGKMCLASRNRTPKRRSSRKDPFKSRGFFQKELTHETQTGSVDPRTRRCARRFVALLADALVANQSGGTRSVWRRGFQRESVAPQHEQYDVRFPPREGANTKARRSFVSGRQGRGGWQIRSVVQRSNRAVPDGACCF